MGDCRCRHLIEIPFKMVSQWFGELSKFTDKNASTANRNSTQRRWVYWQRSFVWITFSSPFAHRLNAFYTQNIRKFYDRLNGSTAAASDVAFRTRFPRSNGERLINCFGFLFVCVVCVCACWEWGILTANKKWLKWKMLKMIVDKSWIGLVRLMVISSQQINVYNVRSRNAKGVNR